MSYVLVNTESGLDEIVLEANDPYDAAYQALEAIGYSLVERETDQESSLSFLSDNFD